jgi:hypothetical protein
MIVPDVQALECYSALTPDASAISGEAAAWELNQMFSIANGTNDENLLAMSIGKTTQQCPVGYNWCGTFHCARLYGKLI